MVVVELLINESLRAFIKLEMFTALQWSVLYLFVYFLPDV